MDTSTKPDKSKLNYIVLTCDGSGMPIAHHFAQEGKKVWVGHVIDKSELKNGDEEKPEDQKKRIKQFDGIVKKFPAKKLVKALKGMKNKDDYFIFVDRNNLWFYAEQLQKAGFKNGIFPTKEDFDLEKEREQAMKFVEEHYPNVQIIPHEKVKTVEEAKKLVEESEVPLVVQSEGDFVFTVVGPDDVEQSKKVILSALEQHAGDYAKGEIIIKQKLVQPVEITPQIVFWNGEPVYTSIDIETKNIGDGENNGPQVGCGTNLIIRTELDDAINQIAFPEKVHELARKHPGFFIWDISLYFTDEGIFFGEFCANRFGYDSLMTEMTMAHGPGEYFEKVMAGESPIQHFKFGTSVRVFNVKEREDSEIQYENWKPMWVYDAYMKDGKMLTVGEDWDLVVVTGRGNSVQESVDNVYDNLKGLIFKEGYYRTKDDFLADYPTSLIRRYNDTVGVYFEGEPFEPKDEKDDKIVELQKQLQDLNSKSKAAELKEKLRKKLYG